MSSRSQRKAARLLGLTGPLLAPLAPGLATQSLLFPFSNAARSQLTLLEFLKAIASNIHPLSQHILDSFIFSLCLTSSSSPPPSHCCRHFLSFLKLLSRCPGLPFPPLILQLIPRAYSSGSVWPGFFFFKPLSHTINTANTNASFSHIKFCSCFLLSHRNKVLRGLGACSHLLRFNLGFTK